TEAEIAGMTAAVKLTYTHAAEVFAAARGDKPGLEAEVRSEIAQLFRDGMPDAEGLMFHTFDWHGELNVMLRGIEGGIRVDLCEKAESFTPNEGPLKGNRVFVPVPFSEDEN
uniref:hypothetical protein n=1 Tax=uncultured Methylobacterium sp. TaxID=157278 RepID=UPI0035C971D5